MIFPFHDENPTTRPPVVTVGLILINVAVLFYMGHLGSTKGDVTLQKFIYQYGFIPARLQQVAKPKKFEVELVQNEPPQLRRFGRFIIRQPQRKHKMVLPADRTQIIASIFTAMFLHAGFMHLIGNMWFLWLFGNNIEDRLGHVPFLLFYLFGGVVASIAHWAMSPQPALVQPVIGASGAVAVTLGAYAVTYPFANVRTLVVLIIFITVVDLPALVVLGSWFFIQLLNGMQPPIVGSTVAWWAHIGGFVLGAVAMPLLTGADRPSESWTEFGKTPDRRDRFDSGA